MEELDLVQIATRARFLILRGGVAIGSPAATLSPRGRQALAKGAMVVAASYPYFVASHRHWNGFSWGPKPHALKGMPVVSSRAWATYQNGNARVCPLDRAIEIQQAVEAYPELSRREIAAMLRMSRPRITQWLNLLNLAPEIQSEIRERWDDLSSRRILTEKRLRRLAAVDGWEDQVARFKRVLKRRVRPTGTVTPG